MLKTLLSGTRHLSLKPHETVTSEGRNRERYRLVAWNALANAASTGMGMLSLLITIPMALQYLGAERFGIWMTVASLAGILSFMDLGIGNGLVNLVAKGKTDQSQRLKEIVVRGLLLLTALGVAIGLITWSFLEVLPLGRIIKLSSEALVKETHQTAQTFTVIFAFGIPLFGIQRIFFGLQKTWLVQLTKIAAYIASPILVYILVKQQASVPMLLAATYGIQTLSAITLLPLLFKEINRAQTPVAASSTPLRTDVKAMVGVGGVYFALQLGGIVGWGSDALIAASFLGASAVAPLVVAQRLFQFVTLPLSIINGPLWAAYADARARNDVAFIKLTLYRSMKVTFISATIVSSVIFLTSGWLTSLWLGAETIFPPGLLIAFGIWAIIDATGNCLAMYLNGCNIVKIQLIVVVLFCLLAVPLKLLLPPKVGISGLIFATLGAYLLCVVLPYTTFLKNELVSGFIKHR